MCVGGSEPKPITIKGKGFTKAFRKKAKILKPSRKELRGLDRQLEGQMQFLGELAAPSSRVNQAQAALDAAQVALQRKIQGIESLVVRMASSRAVIQNQAMRMAVLQGPPPPESAADPPRLGGQGDPVDWRRTGRHALTIPQAGSGLAI